MHGPENSHGEEPWEDTGLSLHFRVGEQGTSITIEGKEGLDMLTEDQALVLARLVL